MILLVNNSYLTSKYSFMNKLRIAMKKLKIPYYETSSLNNDILKLKGKIKGIILSGSNMILTDKHKFTDYANAIRTLLEFDVPVLGLCFGCQLLNMLYGGKLDYFYKNHKYYCENNHVETVKSKLFEDIVLKDVHFCFSELPLASKHDGVKEIAWFRKNEKKYACGFEFKKDKYYGLLFHPEYHEETYQIFLNFLKICKK